MTVATGDLDGNGIGIITGRAAGGANYPDPRVNLYKFVNGSAVFTTSHLAYTNCFIGGIWVAKNAPWFMPIDLGMGMKQPIWVRFCLLV